MASRLFHVVVVMGFGLGGAAGCAGAPGETGDAGTEAGCTPHDGATTPPDAGADGGDAGHAGECGWPPTK